MTPPSAPVAPVLEAYDLVDDREDADLAQVVRLAAAVCDVDTATVNLLDETLQHQVATAGFTGAPSPREESMCAVTVQLAEPVLVPDASKDPRFASNSWVCGPRGDVRFYASFPLHDHGDVIGTLCVFDAAPRLLDDRQRAAMADLAAQTARVLRQRREGLLLQARVDELDRVNAELSAFAGRVAHDLRNPLTGVLGFLQLARKQATDGPPLLTTCLDQASLSAQRVTDMLDGLLRFAAAGTAADPVEVDLDVLAAQVCGDVQHHVEAAGAVVEVGPLGTARTDPLLLGQVLQNLLGNAVKYRDPDRPCVVRLSRREGEGCVLVVVDNGRGVPPESRARVFELFGRGPNAGGVAGVGIGLATCLRSVEALGGTIDLSDTPGGGLTVVVRLPG